MKLLNPPIKVTSQILIFLYECTKRNKCCTSEEILNYMGKTESYVSSAIEFLKEHLIISQKGDSIVLAEKIFKIMDGKEEAKNIIKTCLVENKYFVEYIHLISKGKKQDDSIKILKIVYQLEQKEDTILKIFNDWIKFLNMDIKQKATRNLSIENLEAVSNSLLANKFLKEEFRDYYKYISSAVLKDLADAIKNIKSKKEDSLNDAGRALEDFLRIDIAPEVDLTKCAGIVQITNELNKYPDKFPTKLNNISSSLGNVRSMGKAHGVDAKLKTRWTITENAAISYIIMIISLMKSYLEFKINKNTVF